MLIFCFLYSYIVHWIFFIHAYIFQTEHYFDATGSFTYISLSILLILNSLFSSGFEGLNPYTYLIGAMVILWSLRLGMFLFKRVKDVGQDIRFIEMKKDFFWFFMTWTLSGLWVFLTYVAGLSAMTSVNLIENMSSYHFAFMFIGFFGIFFSDYQPISLLQNPEPKGNLDIENSNNIQNLIFEISKKYEVALITATHDNEFIKLFDRVYRLENSKLSISNE